ncbi:MAG: diguanylate cyclase, partial [Sphingobium sp.]
MSVLRRVPGRYFWPLLILTGLCFGSVLTLLHVTTSAQDRQEAERQTRTLAAALDTNVAMVAHDLQDYAKWDDAVRHIARDFDADWIDYNVTAYLGRTQGYGHVLVVGPDDRSRYVFTDGKTSRTDPVASLGPAFAESLSAVRRMDPARQPIISGFTGRDGHLYIYSVAAIVPLTDKVALPPGERQVMAIAEKVDGAFIERLRRTHQLPAMTVRQEGGLVALRDFRGRPLAYVDMKVATPGTALRAQVLPGLLVIVLLASAMAGFLLRQGSESIAKLKASQDRALHHAGHDPLTGLPNRRVLLEGVRAKLDAGRAVNLIYMDLDGFKEVNDLYGHRAGDELLREATARIVATASEAALVARMGGDEFAVLHRGAAPDETVALAQAVIGAFQPTFAIAGAHVQIGVSIGVVSTPARCALDVDELMRRADVAMYSAKGRGKNRWDSYDPGMDEGHDVRKRLEHDLRAAIAANRIDVAYQPIVSARDGRIVCVEALARWTHPREGMIRPDIFIPLAEMTGLI